MTKKARGFLFRRLSMDIGFHCWFISAKEGFELSFYDVYFETRQKITEVFGQGYLNVFFGIRPGHARFAERIA